MFFVALRDRLHNILFNFCGFGAIANCPCCVCIGRSNTQHSDFTQVLGRPGLIGVFQNVRLFQVGVFVFRHPVCVMQQAGNCILVVVIFANVLLNVEIAAYGL